MLKNKRGHRLPCAGAMEKRISNFKFEISNLLAPYAFQLAPLIYCHHERIEGSKSSDCRPLSSDFRDRLRNAASMLLILFAIAFSSNAQAKSPAGLVNEGNKSYNAGQYDKAISSYDEALKDAPDAPYAYFDKGAALYKKGDYAGASEAFSQAAQKTKDSAFEAKSRFNQGNSDFKQAETLKEKDLDKALEKCTNSINRYRDAINLDPDLKEAAENIEMVRLDMKNILDQINKQKESQKDEQEKKQETAKQLQKLLKDQEASLEKNQKLDTERLKRDSAKTIKGMQELSKEQKDLRDKTDDVLKQMQKNGNKANASKEDQTAKHLENAKKEQDAASGNLDQKNTKAAANNQQKAVDELKDAVNSMQNNGNNNAGQKNNGQQDKQTQQASSGDQAQHDKDNQSQTLSALNSTSDDAKKILNEEKTDRDEQRKALAVRGYKEVDKDW